MDETTTRGQVSRRTIAKGMAWAAPAVPVVALAPAAAASVRECVIGSYATGSCKENIQGTKYYYIQLCVQYVCTSGCAGVMTITRIETNSGEVLTTTPFTINVSAAGTGCDTQLRTFTSPNMASTLTYSYSFTDCNGTKTGTFESTAPPDCERAAAITEEPPTEQSAEESLVEGGDAGARQEGEATGDATSDSTTGDATSDSTSGDATAVAESTDGN